jgi:hypothetical protein
VHWSLLVAPPLPLVEGNLRRPGNRSKPQPSPFFSATFTYWPGAGLSIVDGVTAKSPGSESEIVMAHSPRRGAAGSKGLAYCRMICAGTLDSIHSEDEDQFGNERQESMG